MEVYYNVIQNERIFYWKLLDERMTTLSFNRKNNLLSLLRGYDLPLKHNYLNAALIGYGKHHQTDPEPDPAEERYQNFRLSVEESLDEYFNAFIERINNQDFWHNKDFLKALCAFTRYYVAAESKSSSDFVTRLEDLLVKMAGSAGDLSDIMFDFATEYKHTGILPNGYKQTKKDSRKSILKISNLWNTGTRPDNQAIINLILDCIVYSTNDPEDFGINFEKYMDLVRMSSDKDVLEIFSENLEDTAFDDDLESDEDSDSDDDSFVVPDDYESSDDDEFEPARKKKK